MSRAVQYGFLPPRPPRSPWHRLSRWAVAVGLLTTAAWQPLLAQQPAAPASLAAKPQRPTPVTTAQPATLQYGLAPRELAPGHWVIEGAVDDFGRHNGCNIINTAMVLTAEGPVVINTGPSRLYGEQQRQAVQRIWTSAGGSPQAKGQVLSLNLHPDYFFGNQAWADWPTLALPGTRAGMRAEGPAYADNLYRLCGDWMKGTESTPSKVDATPGTLRVGQRTLALHRFQGHTDDDLVVLDPAAGVAYVGGLVFMNRVPTTPHANFDQWLASLDALEAILKAGNYRWVVPSHGPIHTGLAGLNQTRDWLKWLTSAMATHADAGRDLGEVLHQPAVPPRFADWAAMPAELHRSLTQWYPVYEKRALAR